MIDMSTWEERTVDVVRDVHLDPRNVRLEMSEEAPESDIVQDLFANEKALSLVEAIVKVGWLTHEVPIVLEREGKTVVVEGNRRLAALKAIQNPYLAPEFSSRVSRLAGLVPDRNALRQISVKVAPSQEAADQLIAALHTGNQRVAWRPARQAAFFQAQLDAGKDPQQLIASYPTVDVRKFIIQSAILNLFREVPYEDITLRDYVRSRKFPLSTLARLYDYDTFLDLVGIVVEDETSTVRLDGDVSTFNIVASKIINDIQSRRINTRVLNKNTSKTYKDYISELRGLIDQIDAREKHELDRTVSGNSPEGMKSPSGPSQASAGQDGSASAGTASGRASADQPGSHVKDKARAAPAKGMFLSADNLHVPPSFPPAVHAVLNELASLNVNRFPNAALDLMRTFLEKTVKAYAESLDVDLRGQENVKGFVYLSNCLNWLERHFRETGQTVYLQPLQVLRSGRKGFVGSKDYLDAINHNHHVVVTPDEVRDSWRQMEGILKAMLKK